MSPTYRHASILVDFAHQKKPMTYCDCQVTPIFSAQLQPAQQSVENLQKGLKLRNNFESTKSINYSKNEDKWELS
jgi:hypothetical protein